MRIFRAAVIAIMAATATGCGSGGGLFRQYEYEEDLTIDTGGAGTLTINASLAALNALRGLDVDPLATSVDRDRIRALYESNGVRVTSVYPGRTASPMQAKVHQQEGKEYHPAHWIDPESVATTILTALDLPRDAEINDVTVRPGH